MNKFELLEKIREKNEELDSLNKELKEITAEENATNLGKCFKKDIGLGNNIYKLFIWEHGQCMQIHERSPEDIKKRWLNSLRGRSQMVNSLA